ncbi:TIGR02234 family membrane protein [Sphaerisporangium sp. NPDC049002]|uniref:TIGR02234 family membrane protein n=1 Tax=Sphaerisporangium sp. NPDC049002 TaxID=3155392 RepID=UPI0033EDF776
MTVTAPVRTSPARRALMAWVAAGAAGAVSALVAAGRTWASVTFSGDPGGVHAEPVALAGGDVAPVLSPLALASLAAVVAVLAARGPWRRLIGALIALFGASIVVASWQGVRSSHLVSIAWERTTLSGLSGADQVVVSAAWAWPGVATAGGLVLLAAGVLAVLRGAMWPGMSDRYDRSAPSLGGASRTGSAPAPERSGRAERALWDALDRGVDPTDVPADDRTGRGAGGRDGATG